MSLEAFYYVSLIKMCSYEYDEYANKCFDIIRLCCPNWKLDVTSSLETHCLAK